MVNKDEFRQILGQGSVLDHPDLLEAFSKDHSYTSPRKPALIVQPRRTEEIRQVIQLSKQKGYKLVPVSSGTPRFRGDSVPEVDNAVIVDLTKMKKIMWVNRRNRVALVEPGVTFEELENELEKQGLRGMMPLMPRKTKSVVGAFMEREPFTVPKYAWDLGDPVASSELIFGDGNIMRTGGGAGPAPTLEDQRKVGGAQKLPISPFTMDTRRIVQGTQGSMAICSWLSLRCELLPEYEKVYFAATDDLEKLIKVSKRFLYLRLTDEQYILNNLNFACLIEKDPQKIEQIRKQLPQWILVLSTGGYGTLAKDQFDFKDSDLKEEAGKLGITLLNQVGDIDEQEYRTKVLRKVSETPYWKLRYKGDVREIFFLTSFSKTPEFIKAAQDMALDAGFDPSSIGTYLQSVIQGTACHLAFDIYMDGHDAPKMETFYTNLSKKIFEMGGYFSRPYGAWADIVYPHCDTFVKYARGLKRIFDPNLIMNPEKICFKEMENES